MTMIILEEYFRKPHSAEQEASARDLIDRRNRLRQEWMRETGRMACPKDPDTGTEISGRKGGDGDGGFRTPGSKTGANNSSHRCLKPGQAALDDYDPDDEFDTWLDSFELYEGKNSKLEEYGLAREHPSKTPGWTHLQTDLPPSGRRTYYP